MTNRLAERLKILRRERQMTQAALARALLLPRVTYTHYELGKRTPDLDLIITIARYFDVTVDFLVGNSDIRSSTAHIYRHEPQPEMVADASDDEDIYS